MLFGFRSAIVAAESLLKIIHLFFLVSIIERCERSRKQQNKNCHFLELVVILCKDIIPLSINTNVYRASVMGTKIINKHIGMKPSINMLVPGWLLRKSNPQLLAQHTISPSWLEYSHRQRIKMKKPAKYEPRVLYHSTTKKVISCIGTPFNI